MTGGGLIAVVGPSGVGKDSVIDGIIAASPQLKRVKRTITRAPELGGEDFTPATVDSFQNGLEQGDFCLNWGAHGLRYGIPKEVVEEVDGGAICIANLSRGVLDQASAIFPTVAILHITAAPETLAKRLAHRGRETPQDVAKRLTRVVAPLPRHLNVHDISNDGPLTDTVARALSALTQQKVTL